MKTTSYKISKQLAEVGFNKYKIPATEYCWHHDNFGSTRFLVGAELEDKTTQTLVSEYKIYPAYDLETLLEALPKQHDFFSRGVGKYELRIWYHENKMFIGYQNFDGFDKLLTFEQEENESLADCAAKLWLKLKKEGLV
jgi:hypothetical protein